MSASADPPPLALLLAGIDQALDSGDCDQSRCAGIKAALEAACRGGGALLPPHFLAPLPGSYARHLVHRDPAARFSVVAMVWAPGQGTPLHDHAGTWCVECVYRGRIAVRSFSRRANRCSSSGLYDFAEESCVVAISGEAGALIPPFEYHVIRNEGAELAVTIHVYGGEILRCTVFEPQPQGGYRPRSHELGYAPG
jgi:predicted metal-dependent enzyme (double-stranded beta helix superfamily)